MRTVAEDMYDSVPKGDFRILESYIRAIRSAQECIYLENQFLWSPEIVGELVAKLKAPPSPDFRLRRPAARPRQQRPGRHARSGLAVLADADGSGNPHFLAATIRSRTDGRDDPLYVHAKVGIVDDRWPTIGSAAGTSTPTPCSTTPR